MSAGFTNGVNQELLTQITNFWGKREDTVININGVPTPNGKRTSNSAAEDQWAAARPNTTNLANWNALLDCSKDNTTLVAEVIEYIEEHFDPRGRLILAGTSRGAANVLQVCRQMVQNCRFMRLHKSATFLSGSKGKYANWFQTIQDNGGAHASLVRIEPNRTVKIKDEQCNNRIPFYRGAHDYLCKELAPPERNKLVETELAKPSPTLKVDNRGAMRLPQQPRERRSRLIAMG